LFSVFNKNLSFLIKIKPLIKMMENKRKVPPGDFNKKLRGIFNKNRDPFEIFVFQKWSPGFQN